MFHPASLLLLWGAGVVVVQFLPLIPTLIAVLLFGLLAMTFCKPLFLRLLSRSRWLFLTMGLLFLWLSPGVRLPSPWGDAGITREGLEFALEHMGRLLVMLALLAVLLTRLSHRGIVSGFYLLLSPVAGIADLRRSIAVRLMLTLEAVAGKTGGDWKKLLMADHQQEVASVTSILHLEAPAWTWRDYLAVVVALGGLCVATWLLRQS